VSFNYSQFVLNLATELVVPSGDASYLSFLPTIIDDAEQYIYRRLDLLATVVRDQSGTLIANSRNFTFPQHFVVSESINVFTPFGLTTNRFQLVPASREFIDAFYPNEASPSTPSVPQYYAMITDQTIIVGPPPDAGYTMEVVGTIRPAPLSATNPTTYLTLYLPDVFFAAACVIGFGYLQNFSSAADNPQSALSWSAHLETLIKTADIEELRKKYQAQAWSPKLPSALATPPRA
jgi:hypothetical protein